MRMKRKCFKLALSAILLITLMCVPATAATQSITEIKTNANGETYGSILADGQAPDLVAAVATNGKEGYVRYSDLEGDLPTCPEEAVSMQKIKKNRVIPVYEKDGAVRIGEFVVHSPSSSQDLPATTRATNAGAQSTGQIILFGGREYLNQATVTLFKSSGIASGKGEVSINKGSSVKAGYIGVKAYLVKSTGSIVATTGPHYNDSDGCLGLIITADYNTSKGTYYAWCKAYLWDGLQYHTYNSSKTPKQSF